jgi:hypothetical protein
MPSDKKARPYTPNNEETRPYMASSKEIRPYIVNNKKTKPYIAIRHKKRRPKGSKNKPNIYIALNDGKNTAYIEAFIT